MPQNSIPETGFWTGGGVEQILFTLLPLVIMGIIAYFAIKAVRSGFTLVSQAMDEPQEMLPEGPDEELPRTATAFPGFSPDELYGPSLTPEQSSNPEASL